MPRLVQSIPHDHPRLRMEVARGNSLAEGKAHAREQWCRSNRRLNPLCREIFLVRGPRKVHRQAENRVAVHPQEVRRIDRPKQHQVDVQAVRLEFTRFGLERSLELEPYRLYINLMLLRTID